MLVEETLWRTGDGLRLHVRHAQPREPAADPRSMLIIHGGCEHGGRYAHVVEKLVAAGWTVTLPDLRGHGMSEGERTDVADVSQYLQDLTGVERAYCARGQADVILAHSFGGLVALRYVQTIRQPRALVLSAPLLGLQLPVPWWKDLAGKLLVRLSPTTRFRTGINPRNMTQDPEFLARRLADPLLIRSVTVRWFFAMRRALADVHRDAALVRCPLLIVQGLADQTVAPRCPGPFLERTGSPFRRLIELPGHVHEALNESDWEQTLATILAWLESPEITPSADRR
uniref:Alpha/beta fold hydrolase n=1 Tax=Schlesneria paludicola TaxID=360056 RepID=A0A7C2JXA4_9PLAN